MVSRAMVANRLLLVLVTNAGRLSSESCQSDCKHKR